MTFPCPNPTCEHVFPSEEVRGAATLTCPRCGQQFHFRGGSNSPRVSPPLAQPVAPLAAGPPPLLEPEPFPETSPGRAPSFLDTASPDGPLLQPRFRLPKKPNWRPYAWMGGGAVLALVLIVVGVMFLKSRPDSEDDSSKGDSKLPTFNGILMVGKKEEKVFRLKLPDKTWSRDAARESKLDAAVALERGDPPAWLAVAVKDYGNARPRDAELVQEGIRRLQEYFGEDLELGPKTERVELAGQTSEQLLFKGRINRGTWWGQCAMLTYHGVGYWFYLAAPTKAAVQGEFAALAKGFALLDARPKWRAQPPRRETFAAYKLPLTFTAPEGVWEKFPAREEDDKADMFLVGRYLKEKDNRKNAQVMVLTLPKQKDSKAALKAARDYLDSRKTDKDSQYFLAEESQTDEGTQTNIGNRRGRLVELRLEAGGENLRYLLLAVLNEPEGMVIVCDSTWENRLIWRQDFYDLLASLRVGKK